MKKLFVVLLSCAACGPSFEDVCEYDCKESRACVIQLGVLPGLPQQVCEDNCNSLEGTSTGRRVMDIYDECSEYGACEWVDCTMDWRFCSHPDNHC